MNKIISLETSKTCEDLKETIEISAPDTDKNALWVIFYKRAYVVKDLCIWICGDFKTHESPMIRYGYDAEKNKIEKFRKEDARNNQKAYSAKYKEEIEDKLNRYAVKWINNGAFELMPGYESENSDDEIILHIGWGSDLDDYICLYQKYIEL